MQKLSSLSLGPVELNVKNIEVMKDFYHDILGLNIFDENTEKLILGKDKKPLVILHNQKNLPHSHPTQAGLYHFAILYSSQTQLAKTVERILKKASEFFTGSADHLVSEAFYFNDPEGNGIELYYDRDRSTWQWENNQVKMATLYIDPVEYINRYIVLEEKETETKIGHIHLKVGDIEKAKKFYVEILGFDITAKLPGALFVSVGGYHHHIGMNTWESFGAIERDNTLGLKNFEIVISDIESFESLKKRLKENTIPYKEDLSSIVFHDPWKNQVTIKLISII